MYLMDYYTIPMRSQGFPALSVPCGWVTPQMGACRCPWTTARGAALRGAAAAGRRARVRTRDASAQRRASRRWSEFARERVRVRSRHRHRVPRRAADANKMFCGCANEFGGEPNTKVCPVCLGHARRASGSEREGDRAHGTAGLAFGAEIPAFSKFDRKNYFYPDMPKDYQISQYDMPLVVGGVGQVLARGRHA